MREAAIVTFGAFIEVKGEAYLEHEGIPMNPSEEGLQKVGAVVNLIRGQQNYFASRKELQNQSKSNIKV